MVLLIATFVTVHQPKGEINETALNAVIHQRHMNNKTDYHEPEDTHSHDVIFHLCIFDAR